MLMQVWSAGDLAETCPGGYCSWRIKNPKNPRDESARIGCIRYVSQRFMVVV